MIHLPRPAPSSALLRLVPRQRWPSSLFRSILPSFIANMLYPDHKPSYRLHPTSYLDGLRGIASIIVFICHYTEHNWNPLVSPYGTDPTRPDGWIQLPYLRVIFSGRPMVHIFFVVSGFALSYKPIKAIHARDLPKCYSTLASSTFRRALRLFGPCVVSTFLILLVIQSGSPLPHPSPKIQPWGPQLGNWTADLFHQVTWSWEWDRDVKPRFNEHLWTIPIEFAHSMLLFIIIMAVSRLRLRIRQGVTFGLMIYSLACGRWAASEFLAGLFLAEWHVLKSSARLLSCPQANKDWESPELDYSDQQALHRTTTTGCRTLLKPLLHTTILLLSLFLISWPERDAPKTPGIRWFLSKTPQPYAQQGGQLPERFWFAVASAFLVWTVGELAFLRRVFEGPLAQYCGRISYAVYICHGTVLNLWDNKVVGKAAMPARGEVGTGGFREAVSGWGVKGVVGEEGTGWMTVGWVVGLVVLGPGVVWVADVFWRAVDEQVVRLGRVLEVACLDDENGNGGEGEVGNRGLGYSLAA